MRAIKFRAWDKDLKCWYNDFCHLVICLDGTPINMQNGESLSTYELSQFTGLRDKNGKEIFEGDIVSLGCYGEAKGYPAQVVFQSGCFTFDCIDGSGWMTWVEVDEIKVIGNIYENPELIEVKP